MAANQCAYADWVGVGDECEENATISRTLRDYATGDFFKYPLCEMHNEAVSEELKLLRELEQER